MATSSGGEPLMRPARGSVFVHLWRSASRQPGYTGEGSVMDYPHAFRTFLCVALVLLALALAACGGSGTTAATSPSAPSSETAVTA